MEKNRREYKGTKRILLDRMYAGSFLNRNIGQEAINLIKADDGENYIYVNPYGTFRSSSSEASREIETVLLTRGVNRERVEVIAKAERCHRINDGDRTHLERGNPGITYEGAPITDIFKDNEEQDPDTVLVTLMADSLLFPKVPVFLVCGSESGFQQRNARVVALKGVKSLSCSCLHTFVDDPFDIERINKVLTEKVIWGDRKSAWQSVETKKAESEMKLRFTAAIKKALREAGGEH